MTNNGDTIAKADLKWQETMHGPVTTLDIGCGFGGLISTYTYQVLKS